MAETNTFRASAVGLWLARSQPSPSGLHSPCRHLPDSGIEDGHYGEGGGEQNINHAVSRTALAPHAPCVTAGRRGAAPTSIERVSRIEREAVDANVGPIASVFEARLQAVMVRFAERSDRAAKEGVVIGLMRRAVIGHGRRRDLTFGLA